MSLSALDEFPPIEPRFLGRLGGSFNRLAIDDPGARLFITAELFSEFSMEGYVNLRPSIIVNPFMIIIAH